MNDVENRLVNVCYQNKLLLSDGEEGLSELKQGLELDSITYMSILIKLEEEFDIEFSDHVLEKNILKVLMS